MSYQGIGKVSFGHIAAEDEATELEQYFLETDEYSNVVKDKNKILVVGRKGGGKSAIFVALNDYLPKYNPNVEIEALDLQNYPWNTHKKIKDLGAPDEHAYINSWKYIVWVLLAKKLLAYSQPARYQLIDKEFWKQLFSANRRWLKRFLTQTYGSVSPSFIEVLADKARNIRSISVDKVKVDTDTTGTPSSRLSQSINIVNEEIKSRIFSVLPDNKDYYILFDQLDLGWDGGEETKRLLIGLILAARDIVRDAEKNNKQIHVVIFLRSDIYEELRFEDKNKLSPDVVNIRWDEGRLGELISKRITVSSGGSWADVFADAPMRNRQQPLNYIAKRTMLRPRDMIQFCTDALENAKQEEKEQIDNDCIYAAERPYSEYIRKEIQDETKSIEHNIDELFDVLRQIGTEIVSQDNFLEICEEREITNPRAALQSLIDLSVLGVYQTGGIARGSRIVYRYSVESWMQLEASTRLRVHPGLKYALNVKESRSAR